VSKVVLDSSAVLAAFFAEPGAEVVRDGGAESILSTVSYSEILAKLADRGVPAKEANRFLAGLSLTEVAFDHQQAVLAASLRAKTRSVGLSFADRACLACARYLEVPVLTADRDWTGLKLGVEVVMIR
jgi:PIN domain nuclease of toxin-antitoxin system